MTTLVTTLVQASTSTKPHHTEHTFLVNVCNPADTSASGSEMVGWETAPMGNRTHCTVWQPYPG